MKKNVLKALFCRSGRSRGIRNMNDIAVKSSRYELADTDLSSSPPADPDLPPIGIIAGNGNFPFEFARCALKQSRRVVAVCHIGETSETIAELVSEVCWIKVGEVGRMLKFFVDHGVKEVAMAGGINRVRLFGGVKLDALGLKIISRARSTKDDKIMRAVAEELAAEGVEVISCVRYLEDSLAQKTIYTNSQPSVEEWEDIAVGREALLAISDQHIGQLVVVREGVIVAVEAVEGSDATIERGGALGGKGTVVVKCAKVNQDMRFDVPTIGTRTIEKMHQVGARVLAIEAGRSLIINKEETVCLADRYKIAVVGCAPLVTERSAIGSLAVTGFQS